MTGDGGGRRGSVRRCCASTGPATAPSDPARVHPGLGRRRRRGAWPGALGHEQFAVLGMSVGGMYALACAARHPDRVTALGLVAPQRPDPEPGSVAEKVERFRPGFLDYVAALRPGDPDDAALATRFLSQLPGADAELLGSARARRRSRRRCARPGDARRLPAGRRAPALAVGARPRGGAVPGARLARASSTTGRPPLPGAARRLGRRPRRHHPPRHAAGSLGRRARDAPGHTAAALTDSPRVGAPSSRPSPVTTSSPARPSRSTCRRPASASGWPRA